jgi:lipoate-protein ligase A
MDDLEVYTSEGPASHDLAFEAEMMERAAAGQCCLLLASWPGPVVVLGYAQKPDEVDLEWCRLHSVPVLRRLSGGTGVIHRGDLVVSLALPADHQWANGIVDLYNRFLSVLGPALIEAGGAVERLEEAPHATRVRSPICFEDQLADTLVVGGRKAVGCSQTRRRGAVLIHAAVLLGLDATAYARVFDVDEERVLAALAPAVTGVEWGVIARAMTAEIGRTLGLRTTVFRRPNPRSEFLAPYGLERWSPVPDDGIPQSQAELV